MWTSEGVPLSETPPMEYPEALTLSTFDAYPLPSGFCLLIATLRKPYEPYFPEKIPGCGENTSSPVFMLLGEREPYPWESISVRFFLLLRPNVEVANSTFGGSTTASVSMTVFLVVMTLTVVPPIL